MKAPKLPDNLPEALWSAMEQTDFESLVFQDLQKKLFDVISYKDFASLIAKAAADQGWTSELVDAALKKNPRNKLLKDFALLDPLNDLLAKPPDKSTAAGGEVERALRSLIQVITDSDATTGSRVNLTELNSNLVDLYREYDALVAATIS